MAFKKKIRGKESTYYYCDFYVGKGTSNEIHINRSLKTSDYEQACRQEEELRAQAEDDYLNAEQDTCNAETIRLSGALDLVYSEQWRFNKTGHVQKARIEKIIDMIGDKPLSELSGSKGFFEIKQLKKTLLGMDNGQGRKIGKDGVDQYLTNLRTLFNTTQRSLQLYDMVIPHIQLYNKKNKRTATLTIEEENAFFKLAEVRCREYAELFRVLIDTGMRLGETLKMTFTKHIFLTEKRLKLTPEITKTTEVRSIPMTRDVFSILKSRMQNGNRPFTMHPASASRWFKKLVKELGWHDKGVVLHSLRHTCLTRLIESGMNPSLVRMWSGHSQSKMLDRYTHLTVTSIEHGVDLLEKYQLDRNVISGGNTPAMSDTPEGRILQ